MRNEDGHIIFLSSAEENQGKDTHLQIGYLSQGDLRYAHVYDFYAGPLASLCASDAIVVEVTNEYSSVQLISKIRSNLDQGLFLKPIYLFSTSMVVSDLLKKMVDGTLENLEGLRLVSGTTNLINHQVSQYELSKNQAYEDQRAFNFLAFVASRGTKEVMPTVDRRGIYYPILSDTSTHGLQNKHFLLALEKMERENYLQGSFLKVLTCVVTAWGSLYYIARYVQPVNRLIYYRKRLCTTFAVLM